AGIADRPGRAHFANDLAAARLLDAGNQAHQSRLACAVGAADADALARFDAEVQISEDMLLELADMIGLTDTLELDHASLVLGGGTRLSLPAGSGRSIDG